MSWRARCEIGFARRAPSSVSLVSSPGAGKTALLERTLSLLHEQYRVAALVGDLATENDALRLARSGVPVKQITTGTVCHLEAAMVERALEGWDVGQLDLLFIENVGNLVCPASYDLGEDLRLVMLSVTEGEDKPLKYPTIFNSADAAIITKCDLAAAVEFEEDAALANIPRGPARNARASGLSQERRWYGQLFTIHYSKIAGKGQRGSESGHPTCSDTFKRIQVNNVDL